MNPDPLKHFAVELVIFVVAVLLALLAGSAWGVDVTVTPLPAMPPAPPTNRPARHWPATTNIIVVTSITIGWLPPTNVVYRIEASTNLVDWYFKTNKFLWETNATFPLSQPQEFFRITTATN